MRANLPALVPAAISLSLLLLFMLLLSFLCPLSAEYDILTRYNVDRPEGGRHFWLYSPTSYTMSSSPRPLPLVLFFHGYSDVCEEEGYISQFSIWAFVAEQHQYHVAVMCGTNPGPGWNSNWRANTTGLPNDIAYTRASLDVINKAVKVVPDHVFAMGHSNGAFMSELLACNASDIIHGIASNAGSTVLASTISGSFAACDAAYKSNTTAILLIHGTADQAVPYNGSATLPGAIADVHAWGARNRCLGPVQQQWTRGVASSQGWTGCAGGTEVELVTISGGNHQWYINSDFRSSEYTFEFFNRVAAARQAQEME